MAAVASEVCYDSYDVDTYRGPYPVFRRASHHRAG